MMTFDEFVNKWENGWVDLDGMFGCQCWDGAMNMLRELYGIIVNCTLHGYACDIWEQKNTNGILNYCDEISVSNMQRGAICVFKVTSYWTPYSHIAMFAGDIDGVYGYFFGTNQKGGDDQRYCMQVLPYSALFDTCFMPKCWNVAPSISNPSRELIDDIAKSYKYYLDDGEYVIRCNSNNDLVFDVPGASIQNGEQIQLYPYNGTNAQIWVVSHDEQGYVTFTNKNSGKALDLYAASAKNNNKVHQYDSNGTYAQKWIVGLNHTIMSAVNTDYVLDVPAGQIEQGIYIQLYQANKTKAQAFHICNDAKHHDI